MGSLTQNVFEVKLTDMETLQHYVSQMISLDIHPVFLCHNTYNSWEISQLPGLFCFEEIELFSSAL